MTMSRRNFLLATGAGTIAAPGIGGLLKHPGGVESDSQRDYSLWSSEVPALPGLPQLEGDRKVDLAIIGGGYTGLSCAYYVKKLRPDWSVVVLESHAIGSGASSRNSGALTARHVGISDPDMPERGLNRLRGFIEAEEIECEFAPRPTLTMHTSKAAARRAQVDLAPGEKWISEHELRERIGTSYYTGAVDTPDYFGIHPAKLVAGHAKAALRMGTELFERSPAMHIEDGKTPMVSTPRGKVGASKVLIATNAYTPRLGFFEYAMYPVHQYSFATRKLSATEIHELGLDQWQLRFEPHILPVTFNLTPSGHFFVRMVLGYASFNSSQWHDIEGAKQLSQRLFEQRYPQIATIGLTHSWHGVTGHTTLMRQIAGRIGDGNIHISVAYNGLGIMAAHNNGYLTACEITGHVDKDTHFLTGTRGQIPMPGDYYRSLMLKPIMSLMTPV